MATSIVLDLQRGVLDRGVRVSDLLRRALVITRKLKLNEFESWVDKELNGYSGQANETPEYRRLRGEPRAWNPYHGWQAITFGSGSSEMGEIISMRPAGQRVAELEELIEGDDNLMMPYSYEHQAIIGQAIGFQTQVALFMPKTHLVGILDAVRNILLNWSLKLEEEGIFGEGLTFTQEEKQAAEHSPQQVHYYIESIGGNAQFQQGSGINVQVSSQDFEIQDVRKILELVSDSRANMELDISAVGELDAEVATLDAQLKSPAPKASIIRESLLSVRRIFEGAGGGVAAQGLIEAIKAIVGG